MENKYKNKIKALIIGCGNIGGFYDIDNNFVQTHSKAMYLSEWIDQIDIFDSDRNKALIVSKKYNFCLIKKYDRNNLNAYDIVSICTPTETHYYFLKDAIQMNVPLIICEKPICYNKFEINELLKLYNRYNSKIIVNYYRRFQKKYEILKEFISKIESPISEINIRYHKGFLNNASHMFDTISYLLGRKLDLKNSILTKKNFDHFEYDPTISTNIMDGDINIEVLGCEMNQSILDIDLIYDDFKILLTDLGNHIEIFFNNDLINRYENCIINPMIDVIDKAKTIFFNKDEIDNFKESLELNKQLLKIINDDR